MLSSAVQVLSEYGYGQMSVARVTGRARMSRRTFYDLFEDREDCFLAVFEDALARLTSLVSTTYERENGWREQTRAALGALLVFLDEEPGMGSLLVVDALRAGPRVLERRAEILEGLATRVQEEGSKAKSAREVPPLTGEGVVGAVFSVIHARLLAKSPGRLVELLSPLMGMIVLPYQGPAAARREIQHPPAPSGIVEVSAAHPQEASASSPALLSSLLSLVGEDPLAGLAMRITYRTLRVLSVIGEHPGMSNREVADLAGVADQGQMSKLLTRLEGLGLIAEHHGDGGDGEENHRHQRTGEPNAWRRPPRESRSYTASKNTSVAARRSLQG